MGDNLSRLQFTNAYDGGPTCSSCGENIAYNAKTAGQPSKVDGRLMNGWYHHDSMKRDHEAAPPFGVSGEEELTRQNAQRDQARMVVREQLAKKMDQIHIRNEVESAFK